MTTESQSLEPASVTWCAAYLETWNELVHGEMDREATIEDALEAWRADRGADPAGAARAAFAQLPEMLLERYRTWPAL